MVKGGHELTDRCSIHTVKEAEGRLHLCAAVGTHRPGKAGRDVDSGPGGARADQVKCSLGVSRESTEQGSNQRKGPAAADSGLRVCELPPPTHLRKQDGHKAGRADCRTNCR